MYECICVLYIRTWVYVYNYVYTCTCMYYMHICMYECIYVRMCTHTNICMYEYCMYRCIHWYSTCTSSLTLLFSIVTHIYYTNVCIAENAFTVHICAHDWVLTHHFRVRTLPSSKVTPLTGQPDRVSTPAIGWKHNHLVVMCSW